MKIKEKINKIKQLYLNLIAKILSSITYWLGVSFSFILWKFSTIFQKEKKESYWLEVEEKEEDYKSQY
ncbi:MAG: hypothetical protein QW609_02825 [Candidatus Aenigmatarchaeota archaeon]